MNDEKVKELSLGRHEKALGKATGIQKSKEADIVPKRGVAADVDLQVVEGLNLLHLTR